MELDTILTNSCINLKIWVSHIVTSLPTQEWNGGKVYFCKKAIRILLSLDTGNLDTIAKVFKAFAIQKFVWFDEKKNHTKLQTMWS